MQDGFTHRYGGKAGKRVHLILVCKFFVQILFFGGGVCVGLSGTRVALRRQ
jgi:hypothetical protein